MKIDINILCGYFALLLYYCRQSCHPHLMVLVRCTFLGRERWVSLKQMRHLIKEQGVINVLTSKLLRDYGKGV